MSTMMTTMDRRSMFHAINMLCHDDAKVNVKWIITVSFAATILTTFPYTMVYVRIFVKLQLVTIKIRNFGSCTVKIVSLFLFSYIYILIQMAKYEQA
jgi:hypothetical protein